MLLGLAVYPVGQAATRLRVEQYRQALAERGITLRTWSFFADRDIAWWYGSSNLLRVAAIVRSLVRLPRLLQLARGADAVLVQREALPFGPPIVERLLSWRRHMIWDVDDSVWVPWTSPTVGRMPRWVRAPGDKYGWLCRRATVVWAGSEVLARWCRERNDHVHVVPTVVDVPLELPSLSFERVVGWIGSHSTKDFVERFLPAIARCSPSVEVVVVGADPQLPAGMEGDVQPWTEAAEEAALQRICVGLYPIDQAHPLAEGKCGLKAILFMSRGIPVVCTPTTTNATIVRAGIDGCYASTADEWTSAVTGLLADPATWEEMRRAAHDRAAAEYSLSVWGPKVADAVAELVGA